METPHSLSDDPELLKLLTLRYNVNGLVNAIGSELTVLAQTAAPDSGVFQKTSPQHIMSRIGDSVDGLPSVEGIAVSHLNSEQRAEYKAVLKSFVNKLKEILFFVRGVSI